MGEDWMIVSENIWDSGLFMTAKEMIGLSLGEDQFNDDNNRNHYNSFNDLKIAHVIHHY